MTVQELVYLSKREVRSSNDLMLFYVDEYEKFFGKKPDCAGCTFNNDWQKFKQRVLSNQTNLKSITMSTTKKTFELNRRELNTVFTYTDNGRPVRSYGFNMTEEFAQELLKKGSKEQIEKRKKAFKKLPNSEDEKSVLTIEVEGEEVELSKATGKQMDSYAEAKDIDFGEAKKVDEKREVIAKNL